MGRKTGYRKGVTISDVAKKANVSVSTVTRFINNSDIVKLKTRQTIINAMLELGYKPSSSSNIQLSPANNKNIALMVVDVKNPFFGELIENVEKAVLANGYLLTLCIFNNDNEILERQLHEMLKRNIDGCIIACAKIPKESSINQIIGEMNIVSIQSDIENVDQVDSTDEEGTFEIIEHLINLGHRKIAFIGYSDMSIFTRRLNGYKRALEKHNIGFREDYVGFGYPSSKFSYDYTCSLVSLQDRPTAIHCFNEYTSSGTILALRDHKLRIPEDMSLTSFDGTIFSRLSIPTITTIVQPIRSMGTIATELLIKNIGKPRSETKQHIIIPTKFSSGNSTAAPIG